MLLILIKPFYTERRRKQIREPHGGGKVTQFKFGTFYLHHVDPVNVCTHPKKVEKKGACWVVTR